MTYIIDRKTGDLIREHRGTYVDAAKWCRKHGYTAADIILSASPPRPRRDRI